MSKFSKIFMMMLIVMIGVILIGWRQNVVKETAERESSERMCQMYNQCDYGE